jgi:ribonuclease P protein component
MGRLMSASEPSNPPGSPNQPPHGQHRKSAALPRSARLTKPSEFKRVFKAPMISSDRCFKVLACLNLVGQAGPDHGTHLGPRLGMAVSRQVDRKATERNRIKRLIRESFRRYFAAGGPPVDFVVLPRRECTTICNGQLVRSLDQHWARIVAQLPRAPLNA